jgi:hypothetical protein
MRCICTILAVFFTQTIAFGQNPQRYISFEGDTLELFAYEGEKTILLSNRTDHDSLIMSKWLSAMDEAYSYYAECTGREPTFYTDVTYLNGRSTIARVDKTCGAACGYIGWTGIEIMNSFFDRLYDDLEKKGEYGQEPFYEFGRNFWFYSDALEYTENDPIVTGYAVFMRFMAMDYLKLKGAKFWSWTFDEFRNEVRGLLSTYLADSTYTWENTLGKGMGLRNTQLGATDLFASFCFYMFENHGGHEWVKNVWKETESLPKKQSTQDAVDNFIIASSRAANTNLIPLFVSWRWPISKRAEHALSELPLSVEEHNHSGHIYPNPHISQGLLSIPNSHSQVYLIDLSGMKHTLIPQSHGIYALPALKAGMYIVQSGTIFWKLIIQ